MTAHGALARSFERTGRDYDRYRPSFPQKALDVLVPTRVTALLDLGAGTGKLTELVRDRAERVFAVDPSERMLSVLREKLPFVAALRGTAEAIPLPDASADVVVVAQAFHWFDRDAASAEIRRVLRPGGTLGLVWNRSTPDCAWDWACGHVAHPPVAVRDEDPTADDPAADRLPGFRLVQERQVPWAEQIPRADYIRRWHTVSAFLTADEVQHAEMTARVEAILDTDPVTAGRSVLPLTNVADAFRYEVIDG
ncbi:class I SAM-dependent methyltransferase [Microbacterium sp. KR10-403]|uniref:class I SAM-dependent methyltransferase n=1 Tax=Microbacterium sp. KR10-403 TaxID=3158581 RepID=UPI0032E3DCA0